MTGQIKDYSVTIRVRNNYLLTKMRECGLDTATDLARAAGLSVSAVARYLNLAEPPLTRLGWRPSVRKMAETLKALPEDLFPPQHYSEALATNKGETELSFDEVALLLPSGGNGQSYLPDNGLRKQDVISSLTTALNKLTPREHRVISLRYGLSGKPEMTYQECAREIGVTSPYIQQIEAKALRKLNHGKTGKSLKAALMDLTDICGSGHQVTYG